MTKRAIYVRPDGQRVLLAENADSLYISEELTVIVGNGPPGSGVAAVHLEPGAFVTLEEVSE